MLFAHTVGCRFSAALFGIVIGLSLATAQQPKIGPDEAKAMDAFRAGKLDEALEFLKAARKADPEFAPPYVMLARWSAQVGRGPQARAFIEKAAIEMPDNPEVLLANAGFALAESRLTETILGCNAALKAAENPKWSTEQRKRYQRDSRLGLATAYEARGDFESAKVQLVALLEEDKENPGLRGRLARANFQLDKVDEAFSDFQAAYKLDPTIDPPELSMARLWTQKQDFDKAKEWFTKAANAHPKNATVHRSFTGFLLDRGELDEAKKHLEIAQQLEPKSRDTKAVAGLYARYQKDYATATTIFEELVRDHPSFGFATANLALVLAESGDDKGKRRATELAEGHAKQNPRAPESRLILGYCLYKAGRAAEGEQVARSAIGLGQITPDGSYFLARILADRSAEKDAQSLLREAVKSTAGFVYRKEAETLLAELDKKFPPEKPEKK